MLTLTKPTLVGTIEPFTHIIYDWRTNRRDRIDATYTDVSCPAHPDGYIESTWVNEGTPSPYPTLAICRECAPHYGWPTTTCADCGKVHSGHEYNDSWEGEGTDSLQCTDCYDKENPIYDDERDEDHDYMGVDIDEYDREPGWRM